MLKSPSFRVPFDRERGNLLEWVSNPDSQYIIWCDPYEFTDTLTFQGFVRGRSAAHALFTDSANQKYTMFLTDLDALIRSGCLKADQARAVWTFAKRGQNYGVRFARTLDLATGEA